MSADTRYNGYTNYETWNVALWIDNDEYAQERWRERAAEIASECDPDDDRDPPASDLANEIKEDHEENTPTVTGVYADLLNAALSEVNWHEIARSMIDDVWDEAHETEEDEETADA